MIVLSLPDVTAALGQLARHALGRIKDVTVIAPTGSAGKTTTKDILAQVLARHGATVATPGSPTTRTPSCRSCACSSPATSSSSRHHARSAWRTSRPSSRKTVPRGPESNCDDAL
jgi:hypothetical protein